MRLTHLAAAGLSALSVAALAQVATTPIENKLTPATPANIADPAEALPTDDASSTPPGTPAPVETTTDAPANATPPAGDPEAATGKPPK